MTNVNYFKRFVEFVSNKAQSGAATPAEFNLVADRAQMQLFEKDYAYFLSLPDGPITEYLSFFLKKKTLIINTYGEAAWPSDYQHTASIRSPYVHPKKGMIEVEVTEETNLQFGKLQASQLFEGTRRYPKYSIYSDTVKFLPRDLGMAYMDYFKTPVKPIWGYTLDGDNNEIYNASTSTDFEWDEFAMNEVAGIYLSLIGINLKDGDISQFAELFKAQN